MAKLRKMYRVKREEVEEQIDLATERINSDENCMNNMTYEQGVKYALEWIIGDAEEKPLGE